LSIVNLVSGGLDSTLIGVMSKEEGIHVHPLFIDYGQRAVGCEWAACIAVHEKFSLPKPVRVDLSGFGKLIVTGLTSDTKDVEKDAFTPGRNLLFILVGAAYAFQVNATSVSIGLLSEQYSLFPDQRRSFIEQVEKTVEYALGRKIRVLTPLFDFSKAEVLALAAKRGISGTYSCHLGAEVPCGHCVSCAEVVSLVDPISKGG
jgi:7-cyano-7-deazaguanine synthase